MKIQLSDHFTYKKLLRFTIPSIVMMFFANLFNVIDDGFFVSNFVGKDAFVALNIMSPVFTVFMSVSYMLGAGGNAYISKLLGEGKDDKATSAFSFLDAFNRLLHSIIVTHSEWVIGKGVQVAQRDFFDCFCHYIPPIL